MIFVATLVVTCEDMKINLKKNIIRKERELHFDNI